MNAVPFDTLKLARRLEAAGMSAPVAAGTSEALAEVLVGGDFATKADIGEVKQEIAGLRAEMSSEFASVRAEMSSGFASVRAEMSSEFALVRAEMRSDFAAVRAEMRSGQELLRRDMIIKLGSMLVFAVGVLLAAMRFMPPRM